MATPKIPTAQPFTINNLPYGVISTKTDTTKRCATVLKNHAIDLSVLHSQGVLSDIPGLVDNVFAQENLNDFAKLPKETRVAVREKLQAYLAVSEPTSPAFIPLAEVENHFPMETRNFSDFYCSLEHTINLLLNKTDINPNWYTVPMVYNGRTSSLVVSGTPVHRPCGVFPTEKSNGKPAFQPEIHMDFELEMGVFLSKPLDRGQRLDINTCRDHIFGFVLLNDWSARNIQLFEMAPLGPFHSKGSGTSISPWIVTAEALEPILCPRVTPQTVSPPTHLTGNENADATYDIELSVRIQSELA
ncbi:hypothetical protein Sste5346_005185 [Sporothrix stenoceras]|uniref:Fumarylacetoacetase n=1 Tax=Sporothrix stenoceras TaxID=5173 RepID=A0ABR3Z574_9PEZI